MGVMAKIPEKMVLTEAEALELFTFLISSARSQVDEPRLYASMRLLTAAENLRDFVQERVSTKTQKLLEDTTELTAHAQVNVLDTDNYSKDLDALCRMIAKYLVEQSEIEGQE